MNPEPAMRPFTGTPQPVPVEVPGPAVVVPTGPPSAAPLVCAALVACVAMLALVGLAAVGADAVFVVAVAGVGLLVATALVTAGRR